MNCHFSQYAKSSLFKSKLESLCVSLRHHCRYGSISGRFGSFGLRLESDSQERCVVGTSAAGPRPTRPGIQQPGAEVPHTQWLWNAAACTGELQLHHRQGKCALGSRPTGWTRSPSPLRPMQLLTTSEASESYYSKPRKHKDTTTFSVSHSTVSHISDLFSDGFSFSRFCRSVNHFPSPLQFFSVTPTFSKQDCFSISVMNQSD